MPERDDVQVVDAPAAQVVVSEGSLAGAPDDDLGRDRGRSEVASARTSWLFYGLGLGVQTFLWFLLFLALVIAIAVGGELTEFRYVGF